MLGCHQDDRGSRFGCRLCDNCRFDEGGTSVAGSIGKSHICLHSKEEILSCIGSSDTVVALPDLGIGRDQCEYLGLTWADEQQKWVGFADQDRREDVRRRLISGTFPAGTQPDKLIETISDIVDQEDAKRLADRKDAKNLKAAQKGRAKNSKCALTSSSFAYDACCVEGADETKDCMSLLRRA